MAKIYLATSWKNPHYDEVLAHLKSKGHEVYDFRDPKFAFRWDSIDPHYEKWNHQAFLDTLDHPEVQRGFNRDMGGLDWCNTLVMLTPCGNSAHLELGYAAGQCKHCIVFYYGYQGPDLMVKVADDFVTSLDELDKVLEAASEGFVVAYEDMDSNPNSESGGGQCE